MSDFLKDNLSKPDLNRFAAVIIAAKQARRMNQDFLAEKGLEESHKAEEEKKFKPAVEALRSVMKGEVEFQYPELKIRKKVK